MPYIKQEWRDQVDEEVSNLCIKVNKLISENGDKNLDGILNYCIFTMCMNLYPESYHWYNRMIGMMECCKAELYRRVVANYEDVKIEENGDVVFETEIEENGDVLNEDN